MKLNRLIKNSKKLLAYFHSSDCSKTLFPEIEAYVEKELQERLGITDIIPSAGHYQNAIAHTKEGKVFINFFQGQRSQFFHRHLFTHSLLQRHRIHVAPLVWADSDPKRLQKYNVCCVVSRWISGKPLSKTSRKAAAEAFGILSMIHRIAYNHLKQNQPHEIQATPLRVLSLQDSLKDPARVLESPITNEVVTTQDASRVFSFAASRLKSLPASLNFPVLLHLDFQPSNVIFSTKNQLIPIDFETSAFGPFSIDFSKALLKFCYRSRSKELDNIDIEELMYSSKIKRFTNVYFSLAPPNMRKTWESFGSFFLFCAYLQIIRKLTIKGSCSSDHDEVTKAQLQKRWESALRYVKRFEKVIFVLASTIVAGSLD